MSITVIEENTMSEKETVQVKTTDDLTKVLVTMKDTLVHQGEGVSDLKETQAKMKSDLEERLGKVDEKLTVMDAEIIRHNEDEERKNKSVFDIVMNGKSEALSGWGYHDPITRALYKPNTIWKPGIGWVEGNKGYGLDSDVMMMNDFLYLMGNQKALASQRTPNRTINYHDAVTEMETYKLFRYELERDDELRKALSGETSGSGSEFVPTGFSAQMIDQIRLQLKVAALFPRLTIPAGVGSWEVPLRGARQDAYLVGEPTSDTASKITAGTTPSAKLTFSAITHGLRMLFSYEIDEDSGIAIMPLVKQELIQSLVDAEESAIINGDTSTTHQDSNITSSADVQKSYTGLRKHSGGSSGAAAVDISTLSTSNLRSIRKAMGKYGVNPKDNAWITGISGFIQMLGITEVLTMDKFGLAASVKQGQLADFDGSPIIVSEFVKENLNTSGVYDGTTETDTIIMLANTKAFWTANKPSGLLIEQDKDIQTQQNIVVASRRVDFKRARTPGSDEQSVGLGYSLTS